MERQGSSGQGMVHLVGAGGLEPATWLLLPLVVAHGQPNISRPQKCWIQIGGDVQVAEAALVVGVKPLHFDEALGIA